MAREIVAFVLWIFPNSNCTQLNAPIAHPGAKPSMPQATFMLIYSSLLLVTQKAEIKPYLSVIKQPLIVISAALQLLPLLLKPPA